MIQFTTILKKFDQQGEKTGWTYFEVLAELATQIKPGTKKSFRVRGKLDHYHFEGVALVPMGGGDFIFAVNGTMRQALKKQKGDAVLVSMEWDEAPPKISPHLLECLQDEPEAKAFLLSLAPSHQLYFTRHIESAKTDATRTHRLAQSINALVQKKSFSQMIRDGKKDRSLLP